MEQNGTEAQQDRNGRTEENGHVSHPNISSVCFHAISPILAPIADTSGAQSGAKWMPDQMRDIAAERAASLNVANLIHVGTGGT